MSTRRSIPAHLARSVVVGLVLAAAACGGGDGGDSSPPASFDLATGDLPEPSEVPDRPIDVGSLSRFDAGGNANDGFDRCGVFGAGEIDSLLGGLWELTVVRPDGGACIWRNAEDSEVLEYLRVAMIVAEPSDVGGFDPRLGDGASDLATVVESALEIGDETFEVPTGTYGPGLAFRKGSTAVQVHAIWGIDDFDAQARIERQIEFRVAENLASRLP